MTRRQLPFFVAFIVLMFGVLACTCLGSGIPIGGFQATANAALTQAAGAAATARAQGNSLQVTANAASTQAIATANAAGLGQPTAASTAAATTTGSSGPKDIPLIDPHTVISASDSELTYDTTADIQTVAKFYETEMLKLGWVSSGDPYVSATIAKMSFNSKAGDRIATIGISTDPATKQTQVGIIIE